MPNTFSSTQGNFIRTCAQFQVNANGILMQNDRVVVRLEDTQPIFAEMHSIIHFINFNILF